MEARQWVRVPVTWPGTYSLSLSLSLITSYSSPLSLATQDTSETPIVYHISVSIIHKYMINDKVKT